MKIGGAGMGAIGLRVAQELDQGGIPGNTLTKPFQLFWNPDPRTSGRAALVVAQF